MEPRTSIRGNIHGSRLLGIGSVCFNGAADFHPRKRYATTGSCLVIGRCFNGAADFHPRKHAVLMGLCSFCNSLQWSRGLPSAETRENGWFWPDTCRLQWSRGLPSAETRPHEKTQHADSPASMEPRTSIRGNPGQIDPTDPFVVASMEPRTSIRGNPITPSPSRCRWSSFNGAADFHPRKRVVGCFQFGDYSHASMEPRTSIRGNASPSPRLRVNRSRFNGAADFHPRKQHAFEVFSCQRLALPLASAGRQTVDWTKRTLVPNPQLHACQHLPAASGHRVFALTSTLAPAAKAAHRVSNPW